MIRLLIDFVKSKPEDKSREKEDKSSIKENEESLKNGEQLISYKIIQKINNSNCRSNFKFRRSNFQCKSDFRAENGRSWIFYSLEDDRR
jgi:hypothetical protein